MLKFQIIPVTPYQQNCSVVWCTETQAAAVIDPGGDLPLIEKVLNAHQLRLESILITHGHLDHVAGTVALQAHYSVPVIGPHPEDKFWLDQLAQACLRSGFPPSENFEPSQWLHDGDSVKVGNNTLEVLHCPGHTPGHVVLFHRPSKLAWVGDVLFQGSIGRTDFPRGDYETLITAIREKLWPLGDDVAFIPGHGPMSTFGRERVHNPFVADTRFS